MPVREAFLAAAGLAAAASLRAPSSAGAGVVRAVVALDGSGDFPTIQRAVDHILDHTPRERVTVPRDRVRLHLCRVAATSTTISGNRSAAAAGGSFFRQVMEANADGFEAYGIAFENTFASERRRWRYPSTPTAPPSATLAPPNGKARTGLGKPA